MRGRTWASTTTSASWRPVQNIWQSRIWDKEKELHVSAIVWAAGFPCREVSSVNFNKRGLRVEDTARFEEARQIYDALAMAKPEGSRRNIGPTSWPSPRTSMIALRVLVQRAARLRMAAAGEATTGAVDGLGFATLDELGADGRELARRSRALTIRR